MSTPRACEECSQPIPEDAAGGCPRCSFALALSSSPRLEREEFGNYESLKEIGRGSMGVVYRAIQKGLNRPVAIKMISAGLFATDEQVRMFRSEARAAARLEHANVVRVYEADEHEGHHFFSMELVEGSSLSRLLHDGPLEPERAARYVRGIARAMEYAHGRGVFHRDLKPSNVLLDASDQPRVTDFGLARHVEDGSSQTATGEARGTPSFMPPEQARGRPSGRDHATNARGDAAARNDADARSDVYSMGATLYALICGRPPFYGNTAVETLRQVIDTEPKPPRSINPKIPKDLEAISLACLSKDPSLRYASAQELAEDLDRFIERLPIHPPRIRVVRLLLRWTRSKPLLIGAAILIGVLALGALRAGQLRDNRYAAEDNAPKVLQRFRAWGAVLVARVGSEELLAPLRARDPLALAQFAAERRAAAGPAFESVLVLDEKGVVLARDPPSPRIIGRTIEARDYFRGAVRRREQVGLDAVHVSRVFPGQSDNLMKFAVSVPIGDRTAPGTPLLGVLAATLTSDSTMGLPLHEREVLVGRWDLERVPGDVPTPFDGAPTRVIVLHPAFKHGDPPMAADSPVLAQFSPDPSSAELTEGTRAGAVESNYVDPMRKRQLVWTGPWLVGMAPVGNTEYVLLVQTRDWIGIGLVGALALLGLGGALALVRNRRMRARAA